MGLSRKKRMKEGAEGAGLTWAASAESQGLFFGIKPHKAGMDGGWMWRLPKVLRSCEGAQASGMSIFAAEMSIFAE